MFLEASSCWFADTHTYGEHANHRTSGQKLHDQWYGEMLTPISSFDIFHGGNGSGYLLSFSVVPIHTQLLLKYRLI